MIRLRRHSPVLCQWVAPCEPKAEPMKKIPKKYSGFVLGGLMAIAMGLIISFVVTLINLGMVEDFPKRWMVAFLGALPIQFPVAFFLTPVVKALVDRISE